MSAGPAPAGPGRGALRVAATVAGVLAALLAIATTRVVLSARAEAVRGAAAAARGETRLAIDAFERAGRLRVPLGRTPALALDRLEAIAARADAAGDAATARAALEAARRALLGSRAFGVADPARRARVDTRLAALLGAADAGPEDEAARRAWHAAALARDDAPEAGFALLAVLGFALWVGGAAALALTGLGPDLTLRRRPALLAAAALGCGLVAWVIGLWRA